MSLFRYYAINYLNRIPVDLNKKPIKSTAKTLSGMLFKIKTVKQVYTSNTITMFKTKTGISKNNPAKITTNWSRYCSVLTV